MDQLTVVAGTLNVVPPSLEISRETMTVGISAVTPQEMPTKCVPARWLPVRLDTTGFAVRAAAGSRSKARPKASDRGAGGGNEEGVFMSVNEWNWNQSRMGRCQPPAKTFH